MSESRNPERLGRRKLDLIFRILPESKSGYRIYRKKIEEYFVLRSEGADNSLILAKAPGAEIPDFITPVFASGIFMHEGQRADVSVHEEADDAIEIEIYRDEISKNNGRITHDIIYSDWIPGMNAPGDNSPVREVILFKDKYLLAISPSHKKIWLHDYSSGVNHFLSTGPFYSNLCLVKGIRNPEIVFDTKSLFIKLDTYADNELISAAYLYDKNLKKFGLEMPAKPLQQKKSSFFSKIFKKG